MPLALSAAMLTLAAHFWSISQNPLHNGNARGDTAAALFGAGVYFLGYLIVKSKEQ